MKALIKSTILAVLLAGAMLAAVTQITDTIKNASGQPMNGTVTFAPVGVWTDADGNIIARSPVSARFASGALSLSLVPGNYTVTWQPSSLSAPQCALIPVTTSTISLMSAVIPCPQAVPSGAVLPNFADDETPGGTVNGTNAVFTLAHIPNPTASLILTRNSLAEQNCALVASGAPCDYNLSGLTVTYVTGAIPQGGDIPDVLKAWYRY